MFLLNGKKIHDNGFELGDIRYPPGWIAKVTEEDRAAIGITVVPDPVWPDRRFYDATENEDGSLSITSKPVDDVRNMVWEQVKAHRDALMEAGCKVGTDWFHNDVKSRTQWERMVNRANSSGMDDAAPYMIGGQQVAWKTMAGDFVPLTAGIIRAVVAAFELQEVSVFVEAEMHKQALWQLADVDAIAAYDWRAGWPAVYVPAA